MLALLQQQDYLDQSVMRQLVESKQLKHTDFEGYRAMSSNSVHRMPRDLNGLKSALKPKRFMSPLRRSTSPIARSTNKRHQAVMQGCISKGLIAN